MGLDPSLGSGAYGKIHRAEAMALLFDAWIGTKETSLAPLRAICTPGRRGGCGSAGFLVSCPTFGTTVVQHAVFP